jgi:hypothetical protein
VTRDKIVEYVKSIRTVFTNNEEINQLLDQLDDVLQNAHISDLIFQDHRNLTSEQIVDEAIRKEAEHRAQTAGP